MSESTVIEPYGAKVQSLHNFGISVWTYCSCTANPFGSINISERTTIQLLTLAWLLNLLYIQSTNVHLCNIQVF